MTGFSDGLAVDLVGSNIHSVVIHVGPIDTEIWEQAAADTPIRFRGKKLPPSAVSKAVFRCLEKRRHDNKEAAALLKTLVAEREKQQKKQQKAKDK